MDSSLFAFRFRQYELIVCQRTAETGDCMQYAARCQPCLQNTQRVGSSRRKYKASLVRRSATALSDHLGCPSRSLTGPALSRILPLVQRHCISRHEFPRVLVCAVLRVACGEFGCCPIKSQSQQLALLRGHSCTPSHQAQQAFQ